MTKESSPSKRHLKLPPGYMLVLQSNGPMALKGVEVIHQLSLIEGDLKKSRLAIGDSTEPVIADLIQHAVKVAAKSIKEHGHSGVNAGEDDAEKRSTHTVSQRMDLAIKFATLVGKIAPWVGKT